MASLLSEVFQEADNESGTLSWVPKPTIIPTGPYQTRSTVVASCQSLDDDLISLRLAISSFNRSVSEIRALLKQNPRDQTLIDGTGRVARMKRDNLKILLEKMRDKVKTNGYINDGCTKTDIAKVTEIVRNIGGEWRTIGDVNTLRDQLVYWLWNRR